MSTRLKCLLLDANVVIRLFELKLWRAFTERYEVYVSGSIAEKEVSHYWDEGGKRIPIDLVAEAKRGLVKILSLDAEQAYSAVYDTVDKQSGPQIQMGEMESLAIMTCEGYSGLVFCTADQAAVLAACLLDMSDRLVSLEEALSAGGIKAKVGSQFTKGAMKRWKKKGSTWFVQGFGLREPRE